MNRGVCLPFIAIALAVALCCNAASTANRRELSADTAFNQERYLSPAPRILPGPFIDPAPMVLPSNAIDATEEIEPAGAIQPAPQIQPAPVILPSDAIKEKNRAYPPAKRNGMQGFSHTRQAVQEVIIIEHQIAASEIKNRPAQPPSNTVNNNNATRAKQNGHEIFNSVIIPAKHTSQKISPSWKAGHNSNSSRPDLNSEAVRQNKYSRTHKNIVKNEENMDDSRHDGRTAKPQTEQKRKNFVKITQKKRNQNKLSKYAFYKRPKTYSESEKGHLKKNGAILYPATLYVPTPFHFTLKTTKVPTKKPQAAKVAKQKKPMLKLKKCPPKIRPVEKNGARLVPTQTSFIKPTKFPTKANKAPMQKQITRPTKKRMTAQVLGGCTTADESQAKPMQQRVVVESTQTMFIPPNERKDVANDAPSKTTFSGQQTFNIKQQPFFTSNFKSKPADKLSESYKKHKKISKSKASIILNNRNRKLKRHFHTAKYGAHSRNNANSKRHAKNWTKTPKGRVASVDEVGSRSRRQLVFPFNIGNQEQTNPLVQQFLPNLPLQQALPDSQQVLGQMITGQTGQQFLPQGALLDNQNLLSPFIGQQGLVQQQPLQQSPVFQTMKSPFLVQPQFALTAPALQPASNPPSIPVLSNLEYQRPPVTGAVIPVQYQPQTSVTGQSRQSIPEVSEYTEEDEYPHRRRHHHRFRSSKRNERYPYDTFSSFEDTYGKSPGIFDDLRDISSKMNKYDHDEGYRHQPREWVENGYDEVRVRHHGRHRNPFHTGS